MNFACELMDLCRGTQEVEAVLSEGCVKSGSRDPLARLKMAVEYEEKKVIAQILVDCFLRRTVLILALFVSGERNAIGRAVRLFPLSFF